jgi:hypothetical protein
MTPDRQRNLYLELQQYYGSNPRALAFLKEFVARNVHVVPQSRREIDKFLVHDCKSTVLHLRYQEMLRTFSKEFFDPFRRGERVSFADIETTIGQMNFVRWFFEQNVSASIMHFLPTEAASAADCRAE